MHKFLHKGIQSMLSLMSPNAVCVKRDRLFLLDEGDEFDDEDDDDDEWD